MPDHGARKHAKYSASNAHRWSVCPGQPALAELAPPEPETEWSLSGRYAHENLESYLLFGEITPDMQADPELASAIYTVDAYLSQLRVLAPDLQVIAIEEQFYFPQDIVPLDECGGTPDVVAYSTVLRHVWIIDLKYGVGIIVEVTDNKQLLTYAASIVWVKALAFSRATLVIVQPRAEHRDGPVREWIIGVSEILDFVAEVDTWLRRAATDAKLVPGDHCRKPLRCSAAAICPALERTALALAKENFATVHDLVIETQAFGNKLPVPVDLSNERIGLILHQAPLLETWLQSVREHAVAQLKSNIRVPGFKLAEAQARRRWIDDGPDTAEKLMHLYPGVFSMDMLAPRKMTGITDIEERIAKLAKADAPHGQKGEIAKRVREQLDTLTIKESSGNLTLVPEDDARPAVNAAAVAFAGVTVPLTEQELFE